MLLHELKQLVSSTADAAFAADGAGTVVAWNVAAADLFGVPAAEAVGRPCGQLLNGSDECGQVCSLGCAVLQAVNGRRPVRNFDLHVNTRRGRFWCNVSVLLARVANSPHRNSIHILRLIDLRKRLEMVVSDFIVKEAGLPAQVANAIVSTIRSPAREVALSGRELEVLRLLARGATTRKIAERLHIACTTVGNHIQHILHKLSAHTRLEAIRRAEHARLI